EHRVDVLFALAATRAAAATTAAACGEQQRGAHADRRCSQCEAPRAAMCQTWCHELEPPRLRADSVAPGLLRLADPCQQSACNHQALDLIRTLAVQHERCVAEISLDRELRGVPDAAVDSHRLGGAHQRG